jgi:hypothetical protein
MSQPEVASGSQPEVASESQLESQLELLLSQEESPESRHLTLLNRQEMKMWQVVKSVFRVWKSHTTLQRLMKDGIIAAYATVQVEMPCGLSRAFLPEAQHMRLMSPDNDNGKEPATGGKYEDSAAKRQRLASS